MTAASEAEFAEFYTTHFHRIAAQLYAYLGDHAEAQDLTQEAFCRALARWAKVSTFDNPPAWVRQVAWNLATSRLRHLQVAMRHWTRQRVEHVDGPSPDRVALTRALATLPPNHRLAVVLHHLAHLSTAEIAEQQGVAVGTVRSWLSRGRSQLAEYFVEREGPDWQAASTGAIRPAGVEATAATVRRRRTVRRSALAAALVLTLVIPLTLLLRGSGAPPVIGPTVPPSPTVSPSVEVRKVDLGGVTLPEPPSIYFLDGRNGWLHQGLLLARTDDGGKTWQRLSVPEPPVGAMVTPYFRDGDTVMLQVNEGNGDVPSFYWLTKDRGKTWKSYPPSQPPIEGELALGRFHLRCPGRTGFDGGPPCFESELVQAGVGPVSTPDWFDNSFSVLNGKDGRVWLVKPEAVAVSSDEARTWQRLPAPPPGEQPRFELSRDGKQLFYLAGDKIWELAGDRWVERMTLPETLADGVWATYLADGLWLFWRPDGVSYLQDGVVIPIRELQMSRGGYLADDGTLVINAEDGDVYLGYGNGRERDWILVQH